MAYILIPLFVIAVAGIGSWFTSQGMSWYHTLHFPAITPSGAFIGGVWTILFILLTVAAILYWQKSRDEERASFLALFILNGVLNTFWSYLFFYSHNIAGAFIEVWFLNLTVLLLIITLWRRYRAAAYLLIPYLVWVSFATYLNWLILRLN